MYSGFPLSPKTNTSKFQFDRKCSNVVYMSPWLGRLGNHSLLPVVLKTRENTAFITIVYFVRQTNERVNKIGFSSGIILFLGSQLPIDKEQKYKRYQHLVLNE